ncbi:MAG TPA: patatin-like phospholipase family protein, partial [Solirubrobacteraceae bacterium]|nr:patatin-like phospholipase family protein [Solirubrobacteraceae bacterium]
TVLREVARGGAVGELALVTGQPRSASVRARRDSELLEIGARAFDALLEAHAATIARHLADQLRASRALQPPAPPPIPTTIAVAGAGDRWTGALVRELGRFGTVAVLDEAKAGESPGWAGALDRAEAGADQVLLVAGEAGATGEWVSFCRRQADRAVELPGPGTSEAGGEERWEPAVLARRLAGRAVGVVLSGGGARGLAHIGVLEGLAEAGVTIDRVGGCSMGALVGAQLALGREPAEIRERCREELVARNPLGDYTVPRVALTRGRRGRAMLDRLLGTARIEDLPRDFFCVSSDLVAGTLAVHRDGRLADAVAASVALPGIVPPVRLGGRVLVDGGVLDNLPVAEMAATGEGPVIAVDVTARFDPAARAGIRETLLRTLVLGSSDTAAAAQAHADLVIEPDVTGIGMLDFARLDELVARGRDAARRQGERTAQLTSPPGRPGRPG